MSAPFNRTRVIQEIVTYFGKFAKIQEIIALTAQNVQEATKQIITTPPTIKMKLDVDIGNPYLVVPASTHVQDHYFCLDLGIRFISISLTSSGHISLHNEITPRGVELVDTIKVNVYKVYRYAVMK